MKLKELKALLGANPNKQFLIQLPDTKQVPLSFHITEVGQINKTFIDCGGKVHSVQTCQLQVWVGDDIDHRDRRPESFQIESMLPLKEVRHPE